MEEVTIGTTLYLYEESYRARGGAPAERERACYRPHVITGETKGKWLSNDGFGEYEINKKTLLMSGVRNRYYGPQQFYTAQQVEDRLWDFQHRREVVRLVDRADVTILKQIAALVGYDAG